MKTVVIIPAHNESRTVGTLILSLRTLLPQVDVVVVNDASTDSTAEVAAAAGAQVLNLPINLGYGGAVQTGFKYTITQGYDIVVQMDADGQHDPACVSRLLQALEKGGVDVVVGSRFLENCGYKVPFFRRIGMWLFGTIATLATHQKVTDSTSGFQALRQSVVKFLAEEHYPSDFPDADILILFHRAGFRVVEVPVVMHQRVWGQSMTARLKSLYYIFKMCLSILVTLLRAKPKMVEVVGA